MQAAIVAMLCDATPAQSSQSLVAAVLLGRDNWDVAAADAPHSARTQKLRHAVVNLLVAVLGAPDNNHLMMLLLEPRAMLGTYPVGFVYGLCPGPEGYHFDCGCVLDDHGRALRNRPPLRNDHLHWVNFCSWAMLAVGLLAFPETCDTIDQVLTNRYVQEVDPRRATRGESQADMARSFAMNYAMRCFECVCSHQGLTEEDRSLAFARLFHNFRERAVVGPPEFNRTFASAEGRLAYETTWSAMVDEVVRVLPELRHEAMQVSKAQGQLMRLQEFRASLSYLHKFFHSFEACALALPWEPDFAFVAALVNRREELAHLPLLGHFVQIQNWIFDRLSGVVPTKCLDSALVVLRHPPSRVNC